MAKVYSPNKNYNGITATIKFINGVGETDNKYLIKWFKEHRYKVVDDKVEENIKTKEDKNTEVEAEKEIDYTSLSYTDLKKIAAKKNINSFKVKKNELIEKLENLK